MLMELPEGEGRRTLSEIRSSVVSSSSVCCAWHRLLRESSRVAEAIGASWRKHFRTEREQQLQEQPIGLGSGACSSGYSCTDESQRKFGPGTIHVFPSGYRNGLI